MKKILSIILAASLCLSILAAFSGCGCEHPQSKLKLESTTATCTQAGVETYECSSCGEKGVVTKEVKAYGHNYNVKVEEHDNYKCKYCDNLWQNLTFNNTPETIKVYYKQSISAAATTLAEFTVNGIDWQVFDDGIRVSITVTPTVVNTPSTAEKGVKLAVSLFNDDGEEILLRSNAITFDSSDVNQPETLWCYKSEYYYFDEQYSFKADVYTSCTVGYDKNGNYGLLSYSK